jgi:hypothetical protein
MSREGKSAAGSGGIEEGNSAEMRRVTEYQCSKYFGGVRRYYTVKKVSDFPVPSRDVSNLTLPGQE